MGCFIWLTVKFQKFPAGPIWTEVLDTTLAKSHENTGRITSYKTWLWSLRRWLQRVRNSKALWKILRDKHFCRARALKVSPEGWRLNYIGTTWLIKKVKWIFRCYLIPKCVFPLGLFDSTGWASAESSARCTATMEGTPLRGRWLQDAWSIDGNSETINRMHPDIFPCRSISLGSSRNFDRKSKCFVADSHFDLSWAMLSNKGIIIFGILHNLSQGSCVRDHESFHPRQ